MTDATTVIPFSKWAQKVNEIVRKNNFTIDVSFLTSTMKTNSIIH